MVSSLGDRQPLAEVAPDDAVARSRAISNLIAKQANSGTDELLTSFVPERLVFPQSGAVAGVRSLRLLRTLSQPLPHAELLSVSENSSGLKKPQQRKVPPARRAQSGLSQPPLKEQPESTTIESARQKLIKCTDMKSLREASLALLQEQGREEQQLRTELEELRHELAKAELSSGAREKELRQELESVKQQRDQALTNAEEVSRAAAGARQHIGAAAVEQKRQAEWARAEAAQLRAELAHARSQLRATAEEATAQQAFARAHAERRQPAGPPSPQQQLSEEIEQVDADDPDYEYDDDSYDEQEGEEQTGEDEPQPQPQPQAVSSSEPGCGGELRSLPRGRAACREDELCAPCEPVCNPGHDASFAPRQDRARFQPASSVSTDQDMMPCPHCSRTFFPDRLATHQRVCGRMTQKKKALEEFIAAEDEQGAASSPVPSCCEFGQLAKYHKWRDASQNLKVVLEYNRQIAQAKREGIDIAKMPPPPKNEVDHRVACPHCSRKFDKEVAERHIPQCHLRYKDKKFKR